jgi:hypothetical protein
MNEKQEEKEIARERNKGKRGSGNDTDGTNTSGEPTGIEGVGEVGGENQDPNRGTEGDKEGSPSPKERRKQSILERIRNKGDAGSSDLTSTEHKDDKGNDTGIVQRHGGSDGGVEGVNGVAPGTNTGNGGNGGQTTGNSIDPNNNRENPETNRRIKEKDKGIVIDLPKLGKGTKTPLPPLKLEEVLTAKESKELQPRLDDALKALFGFMDTGIGFTTKKQEARNVMIWKTIDKEEVSVISAFLIERGQTSPMVAGAVRKMTRNYRHLQLGMIMLPRFVMTAQHYMQNGFKLPFGNNE